jgi:hypothetical protein
VPITDIPCIGQGRRSEKWSREVSRVLVDWGATREIRVTDLYAIDYDRRNARARLSLRQEDITHVEIQQPLPDTLWYYTSAATFARIVKTSQWRAYGGGEGGVIRTRKSIVARHQACARPVRSAELTQSPAALD